MRAAGADERSVNTDYGILDSDSYIVRIDDYRRVNRAGQYNLPDPKTGAIHETQDIFLTPLRFADDEEADLVDKDGEELHPDKRLVFFFDETKMGTFPQVSKNRKLVAAALGIQDILAPFEWEWEDILDKEVIVDVELNKLTNKEKVSNPRPLKRAKTRVRAQKPAPDVDLVAVAAETFASVDDDLPF